MIYIFKIKTIVLNIVFKVKLAIINKKLKALKVRFTIIAKKSLSKITIRLIMTAKRDFQNENDIILTNHYLFELATKELLIFIKINHINDHFICVLSCDLNKFNMIFFINAILKVLKLECKFEIKVQIYTIRAST